MNVGDSLMFFCIRRSLKFPFAAFAVLALFSPVDCKAEGFVPAYAAQTKWQLSETTSESLLQKVLSLHSTPEEAENYLGMLKVPESDKSQSWAAERLKDPYGKGTTELAVAVAVAGLNPEARVLPRLQDSQALNLGGYFKAVVKDPAFTNSQMKDPVTAAFLPGLDAQLTEEQTSELKSVLQRIHTKDSSATTATQENVLLLTTIYSNQTGDATALKWLVEDYPPLVPLVFPILAAAKSESLIEYGLEMCRNIAVSDSSKNAGGACIFLQAQAAHPQVREFILSLIRKEPGQFYIYLDKLTYALGLHRKDSGSQKFFTNWEVERWQNIARDVKTLHGE